MEGIFSGASWPLKPKPESEHLSLLSLPPTATPRTHSPMPSLDRSALLEAPELTLPLPEVNLFVPESPTLQSAAAAIADLFLLLHDTSLRALVNPAMRSVLKQKFAEAREQLHLAYCRRTHELLAMLKTHHSELEALCTSTKPHFLVRLTFVCVAILLGDPEMGWDHITDLLCTIPTADWGQVETHYRLKLAGPMDSYDFFAMAPKLLENVTALINEKQFDPAQIQEVSPSAFLVLEWVLLTMRANSLWMTLLQSFGVLVRRAEKLDEQDEVLSSVTFAPEAVPPPRLAKGRLRYSSREDTTSRQVFFPQRPGSKVKKLNAEGDGRVHTPFGAWDQRTSSRAASRGKAEFTFSDHMHESFESNY
jgi:hypothetical protein